MKKEVNLDVLKDCLSSSIFSYIGERMFLTGIDKSKTKEFVELIQKELIVHCNNKIFTALNTNVIRENLLRVLSNTELRAFYFYLFSHLNLKLRFDYGVEDVRVVVFEKIFKTLSVSPLPINLQRFKNERDFFNLSSELLGYYDLASKLEVKLDVRNYLEDNQWFYIHLLLTIFSQKLIEDIQIYVSSN